MKKWVLRLVLAVGAAVVASLVIASTRKECPAANRREGELKESDVGVVSILCQCEGDCQGAPVNLKNEEAPQPAGSKEVAGWSSRFTPGRDGVSVARDA